MPSPDPANQTHDRTVAPLQQVFNLAPAVFARHYHALHTKITLRIEQPLQYKGSLLFDLWKGKGPVDECTSLRGVAIEGHSSKHYNGHLRAVTLPLFMAYRGDTQCGGVPNRAARQPQREVGAPARPGP